jgi:hypothetical protein
MEQGLIRKTINAGAQWTHLADIDASHMREAVSGALEDGMRNARRMAKRGRHAAVDMMDDLSRNVKRAPLRSVTVCFGLALGVGMLLGLTLRRGR